MLVLKVKEFIKKIENNELIHELSTTLPRMSSSKEEIAWEESFTQVSILLSSIIDEGNTEFGDVDIILEYHLPLSSKYCDLILAGKKNNRKCCFIMELKNWKKNDSDSPGEIKGTMIHHNKLQVTQIIYKTFILHLVILRIIRLLQVLFFLPQIFHLFHIDKVSMQS